MKPTGYSNLCDRALGKLILKYVQRGTVPLEEKNFLLIKANIPMSYKEYYAMALMSAILTFLGGLVAGLLLYVLEPSQFTTYLFLILAVFVPLGVGATLWYLPKYRTKVRAANLDLFLPYAINFISSMAVAGISPAEIFQTLANVSVYGEVQTEAKKITKEITVMNVDNITALKHAIELSPSRKFKVFLQGIIGTIQSGSELHVYLANVAKKYMDDDLTARKKDLDLLAVIAEVLVLALVAFPIFMVIILTVMGFFGGSMNLSIVILLLFSFVLIPLMYMFFYFLIKFTSIEKLTKLDPERNRTLKQYCAENKPSLVILASSAICVAILYAMILLLGTNGFFELNLYVFWDFAFLSILILIGPIGIYSYLEMKRRKEMQNRLPDFLVEVGDSLNTGMNIFESIKAAEKGHYGRLGPEIKKMKSQLSWNVSMKNVLFDFAARMKTAIVHRIIIAVDKGLLMGGNTPKIFKAVAGEVDQINQIENQRRTSMSIYALVMMVCFFVFLGIIVILETTIFTSFFDIQAKQVAQTASTALRLNTVDRVLLNYTLYSFVFVQSLGAGLLSGFMTDGKLSSGVRYSCILGLITIIFFKVLL